jgi:hypothetical protein
MSSNKIRRESHDNTHLSPKTLKEDVAGSTSNPEILNGKFHL